MKKKLLLSVFTIFSFYSVLSYGQTVKIDAEIRSRSEYRAGFREPLADTLDASLVNNLRTKLNLIYESKDIKAKLILLDTRDVSKTGNGLGVLEAWGEYNFTSEISFAIGRQGIEYDDKRLFSYNNWSNTPSAHDLLLFKYQASDLIIHIGSAFNNSEDSIQYMNPSKQFYKTLNYIRLSKGFGEISASALWVNESFGNGSDGNVNKTYRNTIGGNIWLTKKENPFTFHTSGYYQFGRDKSNKSLRAYLLSLTAQQRLSAKWDILVGGDIFSGSKYDISSGRNNTFCKLYGTNHAFNGSIEYWASLPTQGLVDLFVGTTVKLSPRFDVNLTFHKFSTAHQIGENGQTNIGSEIDITANYQVNKLFSLQGGWSSYFTTKGSDILKKKLATDTHFPQWAYIQLTFKPLFFNKN